ncbi:MAG: zinc ribbon domain-containing protein [Candidatus Delongbacteria bacterium]|nr:zinc ribbon domain-containing protein [Candidatus Delongbacteria bacterium]
MPRYDYVCPENGRTLEVSHAMSEHLDTWGELARMAGEDPGDTPETSPVERVFSIPMFTTSGSSGSGSCGPSGFS